ncbi:CLUMA_CG010777, isoform A [Clunio marinus]|uniref:CLUMA_CG010777, isoform A n=1 Tax=Clunio marinus TaxID=568069 RepID=A0A1J1IAZ7_9DIPT|nr:CLUMA_CG010777, isoform A [Clunio marinus]
MAHHSPPKFDDIELQRLNPSGENVRKGSKKDKTVNFSSDIDINGNKMPKVNKNVQFSSPQVSIDNEYEFEMKPNLIPNRKREEETVMENLRRRVGECQLDKNFKKKTFLEEEKEEEEKPLLKAVLEQTTDKDFIIDCLCWHNEYRARHNRPSLLHTTVNVGHFTQIVWKNTKYMGVGKSVSRTGKIFVVAFYYPPGNITGEFQNNVLPPTDSKQTSRPNSVNSWNNK